MTNIKKILCAFLAAVMLLSGCGTDAEETFTPTAASDSVSIQPAGTSDTISLPELSTPEIKVQYLPETVENPDGLPVLKWVCLTDVLFVGKLRTWREDAVVEVNRMLAERNMPFRVQFAMLTTNRYSDEIDWFSIPEAQAELAEADLIYGEMVAEDMKNYFAPITKYAIGNAEPSLINAVPHENSWMVGTVEEEIYGIPTYPSSSRSEGWSVDAAFLARYDLEPEDFLKEFWEMDAVFAQIFEKNGGKPFLEVEQEGYTSSTNYISGELDAVYPSALGELFSGDWERAGACFIIDYSEETPVVVNMLETEKARNIQQALLRYKKAGYGTINEVQASIRYGDVRGSRVYTDQSGRVNIPVHGSKFSATDSGGRMSGVAAVSEHKAEAISLLNLIAEDPEFRTYLFYGKEGRDYEIRDGLYWLIEDPDGADYSLDLLSPLSYFSGLTADWNEGSKHSPGTLNTVYVKYEGMTPLESYRESFENCQYAYPVVFDYSGFEAELAAMEAVYKKYFRVYTDPNVMTEQNYDRMLQELREAGSDTVLAELRRQLAQWEADNPDWPLHGFGIE